MQLQLVNNLEKMHDDLYSDSLMIQQCMAEYEKNYQRGVLLWNQLYENTEVPEASQFIQETQSVARTIYLDLNDIQFSAISKSNSLKMISDEELREAIMLYYTDEHSVHLFDLLQERNIQFHKMVVDAIPLDAHIYILKGDSTSYNSWVEQSPNVHYTILEILKRKDELPLALKDTIRSYLLSISQLERIAELNNDIRSGLQKLLANNAK